MAISVSRMDVHNRLRDTGPLLSARGVSHLQDVAAWICGWQPHAMAAALLPHHPHADCHSYMSREFPALKSVVWLPDVDVLHQGPLFLS
jgi:hypothetical protein